MILFTSSIHRFSAFCVSHIHSHIRARSNHSLVMSTNGQLSSANEPAQDKKTSNVPKGKKELKILMIHGYTQSGPLFSSKTKALSKLLLKVLSPAPLNLHPVLLYPTGPHRLRPSDIPGYTPSSTSLDEHEDSDAWAWFRKDEATGNYRGLEDGMQTIVNAIREIGGGIDGVMGFSQGGAVAAMVAAALEQDPVRNPPASSPSSPTPAQNWAQALREANNNAPLKFCVVYSGFYAPPENLQWLYDPQISTPTLHFLGSLDSVVEESRSQGLVERCRDPMVLTHPGGHYVPVAKDWVMPLAGWVRQRCEEADDGATEAL